jgi:predicted peptidase
MGMMRALLRFAVVAATLAGCSRHVFVPDGTRGFQLADGPSPYYVYVPKAWSADRVWPVIVYLHGAGERGKDPKAPTQTGLGPVAAATQGAFPAVVVFPQAPSGAFWGMPDMNARVMKILDDVMARWHGDPSRVYLTGNSLGGFGTFFLGALHPDKFAALVPICGGVRGKAPRPDAPFAAVREDDRAGEIARRIGKTPTWIFHGARDPVVPVRYSRELYKAMQTAGGDVHYTEYPDLGHNSWDRTYADPKLMEWLLAQHR